MGNFTNTPVPSTSAIPPTTELPTTATSSSSSEDATTPTTPTTAATSTTPPATPEKPVTTTIITNSGATTLTITTTSRPPAPTSSDTTPTTALLSSSVSSSSPSPTSSGTTGGGFHGTSKVVVAVVVPVVGVALIALLAVFFWRRTQGRADEDARRKEVEEYGYNPNTDMTGGTGSGGAGSSNGEEMMENDGEGYRGWGSTNGGRKSSNLASSTGTAVPLSPGGMGFSDGGYSHDGGYPQGGTGLPVSPNESTFPTGTATSTDGDNSNAPLIHRPESGASVIGAMTGPLASANNGGIHRGPSNASSNYSTMSHSDGSDGGMPPTQYDAQYYGVDGYENYSGHAYQQYGDNGGHHPPPLIRDVSARRNTRIETPTNQHFPQQGNSGIAQNF